MMKQWLWATCVAACFVLVTAHTSQAAFVFSLSGSMSPPSTFDGTTYGVDTPFSLEGWIDTSVNKFHDPTQSGLYAMTSGSILLPNGTFTIGPDAQLFVLFNSNTLNSNDKYTVGVTQYGRGGIVAYFGDASPEFNGIAPSSTTFLDFDYVDPGSPFPLTIFLNGGEHRLIISGAGRSPATAALNFTLQSPPPTPAPVPEPSTLVMLTSAAATLVGLCRKRIAAQKQ